jgi:DNA-binding NarL/FixJ family response regulator
MNMPLLSAHAFSLTDADILLRKSLITSYEKEILALILGGYDDSEIARQLTVSEHSIHRKIKSMYHKFEVKDRFELVLFAIHYKLISGNVLR